MQALTPSDISVQNVAPKFGSCSVPVCLCAMSRVGIIENIDARFDRIELQLLDHTIQLQACGEKLDLIMESLHNLFLLVKDPNVAHAPFTPVELPPCRSAHGVEVEFPPLLSAHDQVPPS